MIRVSINLPYTENSNVKAWKRKLLKVDELVLPVSKVEPLRSRKRKFNRKKKQESNQNDSSSDSDVEPEKSSSLIAEKRKPQTVQLFDLWETKGSNQRIIVLHIRKSYSCAVCVFCRCVNDFTTTFTQCLATDLSTVLCNRTVKCGLPSVSEHCLFKLSCQMECNRADDVSTHIF